MDPTFEDIYDSCGSLPTCSNTYRKHMPTGLVIWYREARFDWLYGCLNRKLRPEEHRIQQFMEAPSQRDDCMTTKKYWSVRSLHGWKIYLPNRSIPLLSTNCSQHHLAIIMETQELRRNSFFLGSNKGLSSLLRVLCTHNWKTFCHLNSSTKLSHLPRVFFQVMLSRYIKVSLAECIT